MALVDGLQDGVVPRVGKAVVAAHDHLVLPAAHLLIHGQTVRCHPAHGVILEDHLPAVGPRRRLLLRGEGQDGGHIGQQTLRSGHGQSPAAEVAQSGLLQLLRTEEALIPLVSRHDDGLGGGHGLQRRPGHPYEDVPRCHDLIDVGAWAGHHHAGASQPGVHRLRLLFQLPEHVAPSGDEQLHPGHRPVQLLRDLD